MRPIIIIMVTYVVEIAGLAHIIAGSVDAAYLVHAGAASPGDLVWRFFSHPHGNRQHDRRCRPRRSPQLRASRAGIAP
jgi:hypothetical protein